MGGGIWRQSIQFSYENCLSWIEISLKFVPRGPINIAIGSDKDLELNWRQAMIN